jgi:hypothetical protein
MILNPVVNIKGEAMIAFLEKHFGPEHEHTVNFIAQWLSVKESENEMVYDVFLEYDQNGLRIELPTIERKKKS